MAQEERARATFGLMTLGKFNTVLSNFIEIRENYRVLLLDCNAGARRVVRYLVRHAAKIQAL